MKLNEPGTQKLKKQRWLKLYSDQLCKERAFDVFSAEGSLLSPPAVPHHGRERGGEGGDRGREREG